MAANVTKLFFPVTNKLLSHCFWFSDESLKYHRTPRSMCTRPCWQWHTINAVKRRGLDMLALHISSSSLACDGSGSTCGKEDTDVASWYKAMW